MSTTRAGSDTEPAFVVPELPSSTQLWIVRHGQTEWSRSGRHTGITDLPLTPEGEEQARALRPRLAAISPSRVFSSPRRRALDTARLAGVEVDEVTDELAEWHYGDYEGLTTAQIHESVPDWSVWTHGCPGGESPQQVRERADRMLAEASSHLAHGPVLCFGHGHFSRALGVRWIALPMTDGARLLMGTAATSVLGAEHGTAALAHWNMGNPDA